MTVCSKEILEEVKKELHKVKDEIIKGEFKLVSQHVLVRPTCEAR